MCTAGAGYALFTPDSIDWLAAPPTLPDGVKVAVMEGSPLEPGAFTMRFLFPAGTRIEPHFHPAVEHGTVLSGAVYFGLGETFATERVCRMPVGSFFLIRPGVAHFGFVEEDTIIQAHGLGPWQTTYVRA